MAFVFDLAQLDVAAFARLGQAHRGLEPLQRFERLRHEITGDDASISIAYEVRGEQRAPRGGAAQTWLHLAAQTTLPLVCQRCLEPVAVPLAVDRWFRFVADEATAAALDDETEDDVLVISRRLNLLALLEDELLMALPLVPAHTTCPQPVRLQAQDAAFEAALGEKTSPFAGLAQIKPAGRDGPA